MWTVFELIIVAAIVLISITEFFLPIIMGKPLFGSFRKANKDNAGAATEEQLDKKISEAKAKVKDVKTVQKEVDEHYKTAEQIKSESDNLLK